MQKSSSKSQFKTNPELRKAATEKSKGKKRPNRTSKKKLVHEAKVAIIKDELIKDGYLKAVREAMPDVIKAHLKVAKKGTASGTQERKLLFVSTGISKDEEGDKVATTMGQVLAELARQGQNK